MLTFSKFFQFVIYKDNLHAQLYMYVWIIEIHLVHAYLVTTKTTMTSAFALKMILEAFASV